MPRKAKSTGSADENRKRGEGSVHEYPQGSGRFHIEIPNPDGGKPFRCRAKGAKTREEAHAQRAALYAEIMQRHQQGLDARKGEMTLKQFFDEEWWPAALGRNLAPKTIRDYDDTTAGYLFPDWGHFKLKAFNAKLVVAMNRQITKERTEAIAYNVMRKLSMILEMARRRHYIQYNAVQDAKLDLPHIVRKKPPTLTYPDLHRILDVTKDHRIAILWEFEFFAGLRLGELLGIQKDDIDWERGVIIIQRQVQDNNEDGTMRKGQRNKTKTDAGMYRLVPLPPLFTQRLRQYVLTLGNTPWLFPNNDGGMWAPSNFSNYWRGRRTGKTNKTGTKDYYTVGVKEKAKLPKGATMHGFRHTANNMMMELGVPAEIRQKIYGWGPKGMEQHYSNATIQAMKKAVKVFEQELWACAPDAEQPPQQKRESA